MTIHIGASKVVDKLEALSHLKSIIAYAPSGHVYRVRNVVAAEDVNAVLGTYIAAGTVVLILAEG